MDNLAKEDNCMLFKLTGLNGLSADFACGNSEPVFSEGVSVVNEENNRYFHCDGKLKYAYRADNNIHAVRGSISFRFRPCLPVGPTAFPLFRVSFSDHSSWDAVFLRIDYNGHGFDAFVTDRFLSRIRVSCDVVDILPDRWVDIAFGWDETWGVKLWIDGKLAAYKRQQAVLDAGLDAFGPFSRIIAPWNVQSMFNFMRGGDIADICIYNRMIDDSDISSLSAYSFYYPNDIQLGDSWKRQNGWNVLCSLPEKISGECYVHKIEIHDAFDQKRWWWKACDGIMETTWPGVFNRSSLPGRYDYFLLPDWDCYSTSGKSISFILPDENWNHIEFIGAAFGSLVWKSNSVSEIVTEIPEGINHLSITLNKIRKGGTLLFSNVRKEMPINEFAVYFIERKVDIAEASNQINFCHEKNIDSFTIQAGKEIVARYRTEPDFILASTANAQNSTEFCDEENERKTHIAHFVISPHAIKNKAVGGITIKFPEIYFDDAIGIGMPLRIMIHDPIWFSRTLFDFSFTFSGSKTVISCDFRDRILSDDVGLIVSICTGSNCLPYEWVRRINMTVDYSEYEKALSEHVADRFIQMKDAYAHMVEERAGDTRYRLFCRFYGDAMDILRVAPEHYLAKCYLYDSISTCNSCLNVSKPAYTQRPLFDGIPGWVQRQCEYLAIAKRFYEFWIEKRQIDNGEFGGGLSDDGDLTSWWPAAAFCGIIPHRIRTSLKKEWIAIEKEGMLTNGLSTIQTDEMHVFEEGITCLGQNLLVDYGNPHYIEKAMATAKGISAITGRNSLGHMHFISSYYSGTKVAREKPWNKTTSNSYLVCHPLYYLASYNGNEKCKTLAVALADGLLAHYRNGQIYADIDFDTDEDDLPTTPHWRWALLAAYKLTGDSKYLKPLEGDISIGRNVQLDQNALQQKYEELIWNASIREYINTEGYLWVDRVVLDMEQLQNDRLGGVAHQRFEVESRNFLSWEFHEEAAETSVAVFVSHADIHNIKATVWNILDHEIQADIRLWNVLTGTWKLRVVYDDISEKHTCFESIIQTAGNGSLFQINLPSNKQIAIEFNLQQEGKDLRFRPDLAISSEDVSFEYGYFRVHVHSIGYMQTDPTRIVLIDDNGDVYSECCIPSLSAPSDLRPSVYDVILDAPYRDSWCGWKIIIDPEEKTNEITRDNNCVQL